MPRTLSANFVGRGDIQSELGQAFNEKLYTDLGPVQRRFVITGLGGTGKSEVAIKFAEAHRKEFWGIFWVNVGNAASNKHTGAQAAVADGFDVVPTPSAEQDYLRIGKLCGVAEPSFDAVKTWLANTENRWLLIIDNADNPKVRYSDYFPSGDRGNIILTTRNPESASYATVGSSELQNLEVIDARELLFASAGVPRESRLEQEEAAQTVVEVLGTHTLAVIQAGVIIRKKVCKMTQFPQMFVKKKSDLLRWKMPQIASTYESVFATFEISIRHLNPFEEVAADAMQLLGILAFMHFSAVQEEIFQRAAAFALELEQRDDVENISDVGQLTKLRRGVLPEWMQHESEDGLDLFRFRNASSLLMSLGIISIDDTENDMRISMHPLVHQWLQVRQDASSRTASWTSACSILALSTFGLGRFQLFFRTLNPHTRALLSTGFERLIQETSDPRVWQALVQLSKMLLTLRDVRPLVRIVSLLTKQRDGIAGFMDIHLNVSFIEGLCLLEQGKYKAAVQVLEKVVAIQEKSLEKDDYHLANSQDHLAEAYISNKQYKIAAEVLEKVVAIREKLLDEDFLRLQSQYELAKAYIGNGQSKRAAEVLEKVVAIQEKLLDEDHPYRLASQHELARAYIGNRQHKRATEMLEKVVAIQEELLDEDHPNLLASQSELALACMENGQHKRAAVILEKVLTIREKSLDEDHPDRLDSQHKLARAYRAYIGQQAIGRSAANASSSYAC